MEDITRQLKRPRNLIVVGLFGLAFIILVPQLDSFKHALKTLNQGSLNYILLAIALTFVTYLLSALVYKNLSFKALSFFKTSVVQFAAMFINRLLPAGIGAIGVNYLYLRKNAHTKTQAGSVVAINNLVGAIGHNIIFWLLVIWSGYGLLNSRELTNPYGYLIFLLVLVLIIYFLYKFNPRFKRLFKDVLRQLKTYKKRPLKLFYALGFSVVLTLANVLALYFSSKAFGIELDFTKTFIVFTLGVSGGAITPTPGGLGGFEAGLTAGYIAFGIEKEAALSAALLYRLVSYWLTMIAGAGAFMFSLKKKWI